MGPLVVLVLCDSLGVVALYYFLRTKVAGGKLESGAIRQRIPVAEALLISAMVGVSALLFESQWSALHSTSVFLTLSIIIALVLFLAIGALVATYRMRKPERYALAYCLGLLLAGSASHVGSAPPDFAVAWFAITFSCQILGILLLWVALIFFIRILQSIEKARQ